MPALLAAAIEFELTPGVILAGVASLLLSALSFFALRSLHRLDRDQETCDEAVAELRAELAELKADVRVLRDRSERE
jgi:hypothetical protein